MEEVTAREQHSQRHTVQRDDFPSRCASIILRPRAWNLSRGCCDAYRTRSSAVVDHPRVGHSTLFGPSGPGSSARPAVNEYDLPSHIPTENVHTFEETKSNSLCDQFDDFHIETLQPGERHILPEQSGVANMSQLASSPLDASSLVSTIPPNRTTVLTLLRMQHQNNTLSSPWLCQ